MPLLWLIACNNMVWTLVFKQLSQCKMLRNLIFVDVPFVTSKKVVSLSLVQESVHHISQQILQQLFVQPGVGTR